MKHLPLTQGKHSLVDDDTFERLSKHRWFFSKRGYGCGRMGGKKMLALHRVIMDAPKGLEVDHINHNRLDNRRINLRLVTHQQNLANMSMHRDNSSGHKNIYWQINRKCWQVQINRNGKKFHLGSFKDINKAIKAKDEFYGRLLI